MAVRAATIGRGRHEPVQAFIVYQSRASLLRVSDGITQVGESVDAGGTRMISHTAVFAGARPWP